GTRPRRLVVAGVYAKNPIRRRFRSASEEVCVVAAGRRRGGPASLAAWAFPGAADRDPGRCAHTVRRHYPGVSCFLPPCGGLLLAFSHSITFALQARHLGVMQQAVQQRSETKPSSRLTRRGDRYFSRSWFCPSRSGRPTRSCALRG